MKHMRPQCGGAPVGQLDELDPHRARAVSLYRLACAGERERLVDAFAARLPPAEVAEAMAGLSRLMRALTDGAPRPLVYHGETCPCVGAHENAFAELLAAAATGSEEDALLFAVALAPGARADLAARLAAPVGLAVRALAVPAHIH